jgi:acetyl esterase/lipase
MHARASVLLALALSIGCVVPDPGPGDTLPATPPPLAPPIVASYRHLALNPIANPALFPDSELIDLFLPPTIGPTTGVLLWVHGGGWIGGHRGEIPAWVLQQVPRGYLVGSMGYRLVVYDPSGVPHNAFPAAVHDVKVAVRFMKALAQSLGASPRIIVAGGSAGGHLASFVGATPGELEPPLDPALAGFDSTVAAVVNIVGPTDLRALATPVEPPDPGARFVAACVAALLGCPQPSLENPFTCPAGTNFERASVNPHFDATDPPTYFGYGGLDNLVPPATQGAPAALALFQATGEEQMSWYDLAETAGHGLDGTQLHMTALQAFLDLARDGRFDELRATLHAAPASDSHASDRR